MSIEYESYIDKIQELNLSLTGEDIEFLSEVMGVDDLQRPVSPSVIEKAQIWIHSEAKFKLEKALALIVARAGGRLVMEQVAGKVEKFDGHSGYFTLSVGFLGSQGTYLAERKKIRTMVPHAEQMISSPFDCVSFRGGRENVEEDDRILPLGIVKIARRTGIDELPQVVLQVPNHEIDLVGARGYSVPELEGIRILIAARDDSRLDLSPEAKTLLANYQEAVDLYRPRPGFVGPQTATLGKDCPPLFKMFCDLTYWEQANPLVDFRLAAFTFLRRIQGVGAR